VLLYAVSGLGLRGKSNYLEPAPEYDPLCLHRLAELLQSKQSDNDQETANSLHALVAGGGKKKASPKVSKASLARSSSGLSCSIG
jgi:hypothetical protein